MGSPHNLKKRQPTDVAKEDLAIRFVNTVAWRLRQATEERLPTLAALLDWLDENGVRISNDSAELTRGRGGHFQGAQTAYASAIALRETIYALLVAQIRNVSPVADHVQAFNRFLHHRPAALLEWRAGKFGWNGSHPNELDFCTPIAISAAELMTGPRAGRVKQCADDRGCGWLFIDESRAQNRRWCSMGDCGNRAKASRHYARIRETRTGN
ncbi:CGNR zinc finger domain-containing protein [Mesorhizobium sp. B2-4-18]|uniref:CGNR zinc finger domain-containing protein n=1 Tax=Mesorhizobium sp. B2-4-18 TaxID=2589931 RepID=UPI001FEF4569|nr:CGNR zinc finger domain-containing protein [Mesorhizobium sp. B2-4-18]